jgi:hypothetical protein
MLIQPSVTCRGHWPSPSAVKNAHPNVVVLVGFAQSGQDLAPQRVEQGVALLGPVQGYPADTRGRVVNEDHGVSHDPVLLHRLTSRPLE